MESSGRIASKRLRAEATTRVMRDIGLERSQLATGLPGLSESDFNRLMGLGKPVIFRAYACQYDCVTKWDSVEYLLRLSEIEERDLPHRKYQVFEGDESGRLGLTSGTSQRVKMSLKHFLASDRMDYLLGIHERGSFCPVQRHARDPERASPPLQQDIPGSIELLTWFGRYFGYASEIGGQIWDHQQFFASKEYCYTDFHYDSYFNFYFCCVGTRKWTLAPPEASSLFQVHAGTYSNRSNIVPHLSDYASNPEAERFSYLEVELSPGDVLFVPPFWWHLVQSVPSQCSGLSIAFNYVFSAREDRIYDDFENAMRGAEIRILKRQQLLYATRRKRRSEWVLCDSDTSFVGEREKSRVSYQEVVCKSSYTRWSKHETLYLLSVLPMHWGRWKHILELGRDHFHPERDSRQILEKVRRVFGSLKKPSYESIVDLIHAHRINDI